MDRLIVTLRGRARASGHARSMRLFLTEKVIVLGASEKTVAEIAELEYQHEHRGCPCCQASLAKTANVVELILSSMLDYPTSS